MMPVFFLLILSFSVPVFAAEAQKSSSKAAEAERKYLEISSSAARQEGKEENLRAQRRRNMLEVRAQIEEDYRKKVEAFEKAQALETDPEKIRKTKP